MGIAKNAIVKHQFMAALLYFLRHHCQCESLSYIGAPGLVLKGEVARLDPGSPAGQAELLPLLKSSPTMKVLISTCQAGSTA